MYKLESAKKKISKKPSPIDKDLYLLAKQIADDVYDRPSAYKSGFIVKKYKEMGGRYSGNKKKSPLKRWFDEEWKDINPAKTNKSYPVYRPTKRITKNTPLTASEIDYKDLIYKSKLKQKYKDKIILEPFKAKKKSSLKSPPKKSSRKNVKSPRIKRVKVSK